MQLLFSPSKWQTQEIQRLRRIREQCEAKLAEMIAKKKAEIAEEKAKME